MNAFEQYLTHHHLEAITVSIHAHVRYLTVWNALKGHPITSEHAQKIIAALVTLTGVPYTGPLATISEPLVPPPILPISSLPKHRKAP
jgi:hypothetical protein